MASFAPAGFIVPLLLGFPVKFALFDVSLQVAQALAPERFVIPEPTVNPAQRPRVEPADSSRAVLPCRDQASRSQQAEMLRDGRPAGPEVRRDLSHRVPPAAQHRQDLPASGICNRPEDCVRLCAHHGNHTVTIIVTKWLPIVNDAPSGRSPLAVAL